MYEVGNMKDPIGKVSKEIGDASKEVICKSLDALIAISEELRLDDTVKLLKNLRKRYEG